MAGDWVKMRSALLANPKVHGIARAIGANAEASAVLTNGYAGPPQDVLSRNALRHITVTALLVTWSSANEHASDGALKFCDLSDIDQIAGLPGFGAAMASVGWAKHDPENNAVILPNFGKWNTSAKDRTNAERQRRYRERHAAQVTDRNAVTVTTEKRREEKREKDKPAAQVPTSKPQAASSPAPKISWDETSGFSGISEQDRSEWVRAYPAAELDRELAKAHAWLRANPKKAGKRNWRLFLVRWLARCQDHGGTDREVGRRPDEKPAKAWTGADAEALERTRRRLEGRRRYFRSDAHASMSDAEYAEWARSNNVAPSRNGHASNTSA